MGREDGVLGDFSRTIELDLAGAAAYLWRGIVYEAMGREDDAAADYSRVTELEPRFSDMLSILRNAILRK